MLPDFHKLLHNLPVDDKEAAREELAQRIVDEGMGTAAIVLLESMKPISFLTGQAALVATPLIGSFIDPVRLEQYSDLLSDRQFIEQVIQRIEELEAERAGKAKRQGETK